MQAQIVLEQNDWVIRLPRNLISQKALEKLLNLIENNALFNTEKNIVLSATDWDSFIATLENPPPPNAALKTAFKDYQDSGLK